MKAQNPASVRVLILFIAATLTFAPRLQASQPVYVYNSFGPGNSFVSYADWGVYGASGPGGYVGHAEQFVPTLTGNLATLQAGVGQLSGGTGLLNFCVATDSGGTPGGVLERFMNVVAPAPSSSPFFVTMNSITQPLLQAGTTYWLCAQPAQITTAVGWFVNNQGYANNYAQESPPGVWTSGPVLIGSNGVFDVSVVPVPEPSIPGLAILGSGLFSISRFRKR
jgi:X-X-X-Leu-X-X-Gly heptad repeat protein